MRRLTFIAEADIHKGKIPKLDHCPFCNGELPKEKTQSCLDAAIAEADKIELRISHLDCAYGGSDSTAFTCARMRGNTLYLYGRLWHAHVNRVLDECIAEADRHLCWPLYCEDNGDHGFVVTEIRRRDHFGKTYHEDQNKFVKISTYLQYWWPNIRFIEGTDPEYIAQIMDYTPDADHDDAPDSAACCCRILDRHGRRRAR